MSRRVSQLSIINPAKTGQTGQSDESDVCFLQGPEWGGDPATVPLHDRNLLQLHRDGTTETTETGRRVRPRLAHWGDETGKGNAQCFPSVFHDSNSSHEWRNGCNCIPKRLGSYNWGQLQPQPPNDCSWRGSDPNYSKTDLYDLVGSAFFVPFNRQIRRINWHLTQLQWRMRQEVWWGNWIQVECGTCFNTSRVGGCQNWSLQEVGCICLMSIYVHFIHLGSIHSILLLKSVPSNPF